MPQHNLSLSHASLSTPSLYVAMKLAAMKASLYAPSLLPLYLRGNESIGEEETGQI